ncbi:MAG TPA: low temperature requirement protein A [Burkholderiaceae bacterium]
MPRISASPDGPPFFRDHRGHARVTNEELFFDLIYAFAITQLSHRLLGDLTLLGALQTLVLWFAVWLGWQYTCWVTNWFNPENLRMRLMLFALMLVGLAMSATIPAAFAEAGLAFALCYATIQVGRTLFVLANLPRGHALVPNFRRILGWALTSAALWIAGGLSEGPWRLGFWAAGVASEYIAPMIGFALPRLGRSSTAEWTIEGGHLAERNQLFVMIALGESVLATGGSFSQSPHLDAPTLIALFVAFAGSVAMWWIYFDTASERGTHAITHSDDPGRMGAYFHYAHVTLIAGIIVAAVADELVIDHPDHHVDLASALVLIGGPLLYLGGNAFYKRIVYGWVPPSHIAGVVMLLLLAPLAFATDRLAIGGVTSLILVIVAAWQTRHAPAPAPAAAD